MDAQAAIVKLLGTAPPVLPGPAAHYQIGGVEPGRYLLYAVTDLSGYFWIVPVDVRSADHTFDLSARNASQLTARSWMDIAEAACEEAFRPGPEVDVPADVTVIPPELLNRDEVQAEISRRYPSALRDYGIMGSALVRLRVLADGTVDPYLIEVLSASHDSFGDAAAMTAETMRFRPAQVGGRNVAAWVTVPVTFRLH
jgi:TonB family protein